MEKTRHIFSFLIVVLPISLITGPAIPDITISIGSIFFLIYLYINKEINIFSENNWLLISLIFWLYLLISGIFSYDVKGSLINALIFFRYLMIPLIVFYFVMSYSYYRNLIVTVIFFSVLFVALDSFYQFLNYDSYNGFKEDIFGYKPDFAKYNRLTGPFKDLVPGAYISKLSFFGLIFLIIYIQNNLLRNLAILIYLATCGYITFISGERMAFATFLLGYLIYFIFTKNNKIFIFLSICLMFLFIILSIKYHPSYNDYKIIEKSSKEYGLIVEKKYFCDQSKNTLCKQTVKLQPPFTEVIKDFRNSAYGEIYSLALEMYKNNYFFGIGLDSFTELCKSEKYDKYLKNVGCVTHPHNFYLQWLIETGPLGLILFTIMIFYFFKQSKNSNDYNGKLISYISLIIIFWPIMSTGSLLKNWMGVSTFFCIGLSLSIYKFKLYKYLK